MRVTEKLGVGAQVGLKIFMASSRSDARPFKLGGEVTEVGQQLNIANIAGRELELWLCNLSDKIIVRQEECRQTQSWDYRVSLIRLWRKWQSSR